MKPSERDIMLARLDERVGNILVLTEKQGVHLEKINGHLEEHSKRILTMEVSSKTSKKVIGGYVSMVMALIAALWKSYFG